MTVQKPTVKPKRPFFSSGPCAKRPGWDFKNLDSTILSRSHRSNPAKVMMKEIVDLHRKLLDLPEGYRIGITPASGTGSIELAMWNLFGADGIGVDAFAWEEFSGLWLNDVMTELKLPDCRAFEAPYGQLPDFKMMDPNRDAVFAWNGTTSGACVPNFDAIPKGDKGLRICDAMSAVFMYELPWEKLDVVTWAWQKCMGGEAAHGMIVMSPKAIERLKSFKPDRAIPKIFKLRNSDGTINESFFDGVFLNTPSMMCMADALDALKWVESLGGRPGVQKRVAENCKALTEWIEKTPFVDFLTTDPANRSKTSICMKFVGPDFESLNPAQQKDLAKRVVQLMEQEQAGYDLNAYATAPAGLRIWCGTTIETADIKAVCPWLEWAYATALAEIKNASGQTQNKVA